MSDGQDPRREPYLPPTEHMRLGWIAHRAYDLATTPYEAEQWKAVALAVATEVLRDPARWARELELPEADIECPECGRHSGWADVHNLQCSRVPKYAIPAHQTAPDDK